MAERKTAIKQTALKRIGLKKTVGKKGAGGRVRITKGRTKKTEAKETSEAYLTKRILQKAASTGFSQAAARTMRVMGQNVVVRNGWVVRVYADGHIEPITKVDRTNHTSLALD